MGYVATITSSAENAFLTNYIPNDVWISGSDGYNEINAAVGGSLFNNQSASEGKWYIIDGPEKGQKMTYTSWLAGEPNNTREPLI